MFVSVLGLKNKWQDIFFCKVLKMCTFVGPQALLNSFWFSTLEVLDGIEIKKKIKEFGNDKEKPWRISKYTRTWNHRIITPRQQQKKRVSGVIQRTLGGKQCLSVKLRPGVLAGMCAPSLRGLNMTNSFLLFSVGFEKHVRSLTVFSLPLPHQSLCLLLWRRTNKFTVGSFSI